MDDQKKKLKIALVSGASHALKYKEKHPSASEAEIIQYVTRESEDILRKVGNSN